MAVSDGIKFCEQFLKRRCLKKLLMTHDGRRTTYHGHRATTRGVCHVIRYGGQAFLRSQIFIKILRLLLVNKNQTDAAASCMDTMK